MRIRFKLCGNCRVKPKQKKHHWCKDCLNAYRRKWLQKSPKAKVYNTYSYRKKNLARYRDKNSEKIRARKVVRYAVSVRKLTRLPCQICGSLDSIAHHKWGYDMKNRLKVLWLCNLHHNQVEGKLLYLEKSNANKV